MLDKLIQLLQAQADCFDRFLSALHSQRQALVTPDHASLIAANEQLSEIVARIHILNRQREETLQEAKQLFALTGDITLGRLTEIATEDQASKLLKLRDTILEQDMKIAAIREGNVMLINQSRELIARTMRSLSEMSTPHTNYSNANPFPTAHTQSAAVAVNRRA